LAVGNSNDRGRRLAFDVGIVLLRRISGALLLRGGKMIIYLNLLVAVIGLLMYALSANGKLVEIGRIMFFCGLLAFLLGDAALVNVIRH
jgi:hypothetical protein